MANIFLKPTAQFRPFSYQEMLAPIKAYTEAYNNTEKELDILDEAALAQSFLFKGSKYENQYNDYLKKLDSISNSISNGNLSGAKNEIKEARKTFLNTLAPAAQRITKLNTLRAKQDTEQSNNPYIRFSTDYRTIDEDNVNNSSTYTSYDLSKIYTQVAKNTITKIANDFRPQIGTPVKVEGTNSYMVTQGYGMTPEEYNKAISDPNSDLNKYINSEVEKATKGITNEDVIKEITEGVKNTIKDNIGKFDVKMVSGQKDLKATTTNTDWDETWYGSDGKKYGRKGSAIYGDLDGVPFKVGTPPQQKDNTNNKPNTKEDTYRSGDVITISKDEVTKLLGTQSVWRSRKNEAIKSREFDKIINKPTETRKVGANTYSGKYFTIDDLKVNSKIKQLLIERLGEEHVKKYSFLFNNGEIIIIPERKYTEKQDTQEDTSVYETIIEENNTDNVDVESDDNAF